MGTSYVNGSSYGGYGGDATGGNSNASCTGTITATFTWQPDPGQNLTTDPPPETVIVAETCMAYGMATSVPVAPVTGGCDNALVPSPAWTQTPITGGPPPGMVFGTTGRAFVASTRYQVKPGSASLQLMLAPSASAQGLGASSASVRYSAAVSPVTITLTGTTPDSSGNQNILVGQHCKATLNGIPFITGATITYAWSISGTTFQYWSDTTPPTPLGPNPTNPADPDSSYYVGGPGPLNVSSPGWYWNDLNQTLETVSCTATITPPPGQGAAFSVTATKKVTVMRPQWTATGTGGTMQVNSSSPVGNGTDFWLWAGPTTGVAGSHGMSWDATVSPPLNTTFGAGSLILVQLFIPDLSFTALNFFHVTSTYTGSLNGQEGLDLTYPYAWTTGAPNYKSNDNPGLNLTPEKALSGHLGDQFEDYLMYFAPGSTQCVPLARFVWSTHGDATIPATNNWANYGPGFAGTITPSGTPTGFLAGNSFPMWTQIIPANTTF